MRKNHPIRKMRTGGDFSYAKHLGKDSFSELM